jgi:hypothetical protein
MRVRLFFALLATIGALGSSVVLIDGCGGGGSEPFGGLGDDDSFDASTGVVTPRDSGGTTTASDGGAPTCTTDTTGCSCADAGATIACGQVHRVSGGYVSCSPGFITCGADGVWSDCLGDRVGDPAGPSRGFVLDSLQLDASGCVGNPCDPSCQNYIDTPAGIDGGLDSGLVWADAGVSLSPIYPDAGPTCTGISLAPATQTVTVDSFTPFHATYGAGTQTYTVSALPAGCYSGSPPGLYTLNHYDVATMDPTAGLLSVLVGVAEPITVTAYSGAFNANATANVVVNVLDTTNAGSYSNTSTYFPTTATATDSAAILYPLQNTMFPLGLPAPLVQWTAPTAATAVKVTLRYPSTGTPTFTWSAITSTESPSSGTISELSTSPTLPAAPRMDIPQIVWNALAQTAEGSTSSVTLAIQRYYGGTAHKEVPITFQIANGQLKGTVYYNSYGTNLVKNFGTTIGGQTFGAATLGVTIGTSTPNLVAGYAGSTSVGDGCRVCHSVAANGGYLVTQEFVGGDIYTDYDGLSTVPSSATKIPGAYNNGTLAWGALEPNGTYLYANSSPLSGSNTALSSALYNPVTGALISSSSAPPLHAGQPAFSGDGSHIAFNFYSGTGNSATGTSAGTGDGKKLAMMDFAPATKAFSNLRILHTPTDGIPDYWPSFFPLDASNSLNGVVFERELQGNGRDYAATRSTCDGTGVCNNSGVEAELWWASTDSSPTAVRMTNANGPVLTSTNAHSIDNIVNYEPTVLPRLSGGYAWMVFTSRRVFGNVATINPYWSDPRYQNLTVQPTTKKLWVAAINVNAAEGSDPSFSAFYLPGQELLAGNSRGYYVLNACEAPGTTAASACDTDLDCCGAPTTARCVVDTGAPTNPPSKHCVAVPTTTSCAADGASCAIIGCCGALTTGSQCVGNVCQAPPPLVSYSGSSFTRDYSASCPQTYAVQWQYFSWQSNTPLDSSVVFTAQTASSTAGFVSTSNPIPVQIGTAKADPSWIADGWPTSAQTPTWVASANTVNNDFTAVGQQSLSVLRVTATLNPSTSPKETPVLQDWRASYDCVPSQ